MVTTAITGSSLLIYASEPRVASVDTEVGDLCPSDSSPIKTALNPGTEEISDARHRRRARKAREFDLEQAVPRSLRGEAAQWEISLMGGTEGYAQNNSVSTGRYRPLGRQTALFETHTMTARFRPHLLRPLLILLIFAWLPTSAHAEASSPATGGGSSGRWLHWPLQGAFQVTRRFLPPPTPYGRGHRGVDLATAENAVVRAGRDGVVVFAGNVGGRGVVSLTHPDGTRTTYEPLLPRVAAGQRLRTGDELGLLQPGHPGCPRRTCLHWGLLDGQTYLDPLGALAFTRVRLLPWAGDDAH
jgi:murein DD-endopeptidase MepM/ murein hydrolase activator NlpD